MKKQILSVVFLIVTSYSLKLPSYITPCRINQPKLSECILERANKAWPILVKGDPAYNLSNFSPLLVKYVNLENSAGLSLYVTNLSIQHMDNIRVVDLKFDDKKLKLHIVVKNPYDTWIGQYKMQGKLLGIPVTGSGETNITSVDGLVVYDITFKEEYRAGEKYWVKAESTLTFNASRAYIKFENLMKENPRIAEKMNKFIDENWRDFMGLLGGPVRNIMIAIFDEVVTTFTTQIPVRQLFYSW